MNSMKVREGKLIIECYGGIKASFTEDAVLNGSARNFLKIMYKENEFVREFGFTCSSSIDFPEEDGFEMDCVKLRECLSFEI